MFTPPPQTFVYTPQFQIPIYNPAPEASRNIFWGEISVLKILS